MSKPYMITLEEAAQVAETYMRAYPHGSVESEAIKRVVTNFRTMNDYYKRVMLKHE